MMIHVICQSIINIIFYNNACMSFKYNQLEKLIGTNKTKQDVIEFNLSVVGMKIVKTKPYKELKFVYITKAQRKILEQAKSEGYVVGFK